MKILVINSGSSSLKFTLFEMEGGSNTVVASGLVERVGTPTPNLIIKRPDGFKFEESPEGVKNHSDGLRAVCAKLVDPQIGVLKSLSEVKAIGHRVLHGGEKVTAPVKVDEAVKDIIRECIPLGPLHNPANLSGIEACEEIFAGVPNVAVFDTQFHQTMPPEAYLYAIPMEFYKKYGIRKYGFHGTSHRFVYVVYMMFYCFIYMAVGEGYVLDDNIGYADRYFGPALLLCSMIVLGELLEIRRINRTKLLIAALLFLMILLPHNPFQLLQLERDTGWEKYNGMYEAAGLELTENDFLICIGPDHCQYYAFPAASELDYDVKAAQTSPEEWAEKIAGKGYRYLLLEDFDARFPDVYQDMFVGGIDSIQKWSVYDIIVDGDTVKFVRRG